MSVYDNVHYTDMSLLSFSMMLTINIIKPISLADVFFNVKVLLFIVVSVLRSPACCGVVFSQVGLDGGDQERSDSTCTGAGEACV